MTLHKWQSWFKKNAAVNCALFITISKMIDYCPISFRNIKSCQMYFKICIRCRNVFLCLGRANTNIYIKNRIFVSKNQTTVDPLHTLEYYTQTSLLCYYNLRVTCCSLVCDPCPSSLSGHSWHIQYIDTKKQRGKAQTFGLSVSTGQACVVRLRTRLEKRTDSSVFQKCHRKKLWPASKRLCPHLLLGNTAGVWHNETGSSICGDWWRWTVQCMMGAGVFDQRWSCSKHGTEEQGSAQKHFSTQSVEVQTSTVWVCGWSISNYSRALTLNKLLLFLLLFALDRLDHSSQFAWTWNSSKLFSQTGLKILFGQCS